MIGCSDGDSTAATAPEVRAPGGWNLEPLNDGLQTSESSYDERSGEEVLHPQSSATVEPESYGTILIAEQGMEFPFNPNVVTGPVLITAEVYVHQLADVTRRVEFEFLPHYDFRAPLWLVMDRACAEPLADGRQYKLSHFNPQTTARGSSSRVAGRARETRSGSRSRISRGARSAAERPAARRDVLVRHLQRFHPVASSLPRDAPQWHCLNGPHVSKTRKAR